MSTRLKVLLISTLVLFFTTSFTAEAFAVVQSINGETGSVQTFQNDTNIAISSLNNVHSLGWQGLLGISRGGTNASSFTNGGIFFFNGIAFSQDNSNLFWDNTNKRLGIGTSSSTSSLEVSGVAKVSSLNSSSDSSINTLSIGLGGGSVSSNTAFGLNALSNNTTGARGVAIGYDALGGNTSGEENTAVGYFALSSNSNGGNNTAIGYGALAQNTSGGANVAIGYTALNGNITGGGNTGFWF